MSIDDNHSRTIIHIDLDCFYAQVEMIKNPKLRNVPLGIQQKNLLVTSNYIARELGVKKCMQITEALKLCPNLTLVKGEDLHDYRQTSSKVTSVIQKFSLLVEKLGLDENFIDVTELVKSRKIDLKVIQPIGHIFGSTENDCECGCYERINIGSIIAADIRKSIKDELGLTCCAGIAHNKLLAKLGGAVNKPNQQTIVYPNNGAQLLFTLPSVIAIPGVGAATCDTLKLLNIKSVEDLRACPLKKLQSTFGTEKAKLFTELSYGIDNSPVKPSGRPQSIGIEDSCRSICVEKEAKEKFRQLLHRLMILVTEDGRIPRTLKVTLRKYDNQRKFSHREQRQCNISSTLFITNRGNAVQLVKNSEDKIMASIMHLFHKLVDISRPFHVTLLGLAFTKFQELQSRQNSIASFFKKDLSVQSVTSLQNNRDLNSATSMPMDFSPVSQKSLDLSTDGSESEIEPSPKKLKAGAAAAAYIVKRRCLDAASVECPSPSKLRVAELRLNSRDVDRSPIPEQSCPDNVDPDVFRELPIDVQNELLQQWKIEKKVAFPPLKKPKNSTLLAYLIKNK